MDKNNTFEDRNTKKFDILDLPEYDYLYKQDNVPFDCNFNFSITNESKFPAVSLSSSAAPSGNNLFFHTEEFASQQEEALKVKEKNIDYFSANVTHHTAEPSSFMPFKKEREQPIPEQRETYSYPSYSQGNEHAVFVNANQYQYIKRRKERRDYLDSLEKKTNAAYQHESRHKHAMKRPRAPSGRFLTKEEAFLEESKGS
ncbi:hypothetical protein NEMIN01_0191 [Nematocida minor]|uniref:uncharacterized protein n=1 Tax=Nematocida minor TaxID=1912983 RepID=UPI00222012E2|nr:uncharacterized protein NEMIN01_0087 [Nematocida minor]XP_051332093.1 uncharacterized protein NEMIN01_0191 [Nematocida minor]KAI5188823.1 hypothetical protein NEMIN01_0087 [Nematocida minor]KAI5188927.1 hypothetical protein NEMIN01_0191 [Nematocida minor]